MAKSIPSVIKRPMVTEKSTALGETNRYVFEIAGDATKPDVKAAIQAAFNVTVIDVNVMRTHTKPKRFGQKLVLRPRTKKAIVRLKDGDKIQLFENL